MLFHPKVARLLTFQDMNAKIVTGMLLKDRARVEAAAAERGFESPSEAELREVARSLENKDNGAKIGSTMMADDLDWVRAKATALKLDVGNANVLGRVARGLRGGDNVSKRYTNVFQDTLIAYGKYKDDHGYFPTKGDNKTLAKWAVRQRECKRKLDNGEPAKGMTSERAWKLTAIGFVWNPGPANQNSNR
jgi:hypothetical protein